MSISAAITIRWISECWFETLTNSVRSSSRVGSRLSTPMIASISGMRLERLGEPPAPVGRQPGDEHPLGRVRAAAPVASTTVGLVAQPSHTDRRSPSISCRFSWIRARISCATVWTSALSGAASAPIETVSIGSRKRILNFDGR